ncbi:acyl-CoA synthetase [Streptomyces sp. NPDC055815]
MTQSLHHAVQQAPERTMTVCGERVRSAREVADRVARLAGGLRRLGLAEGDRVTLLALNSDRYHETFFAVWWAGAAVNPVNIRWSVAEIAYALDDAGARLLVVDDAFLPLVSDLRRRCPQLRTVVYCGDGSAPEGLVDYEELVAGASPVEDLRRGGDSLAALLYTGGTTGLPKGVAISHRGLMASTFGAQLAGQAAKPGGVNLVIAPLFHIAAIANWNGQNIMGGTHIICPAFSPEAFFAAVEQHRVTSTGLVPVMIQMLCDHASAGTRDLTSIESLAYGGSAISEALLRRAMEVFPRAAFTQGYGMTETGVLTILGGDEHVRGGDLLRAAGRPIPHTDVRIVDSDGQEVPTGSVGEITTRGEHVMLGYWNRAEETAAVLRNGWMHTGDAGFLDSDGYVHVVDRIKDMIVTGGENVYSAEVENAISAHPSVAACAVIGIPDDLWGERVHAVVALKPGTSATEEEIRAHARNLIAGYKTPRTVEFVDALPVSAAGKILKRDLRSALTNAEAQ